MAYPNHGENGIPGIIADQEPKECDSQSEKWSKEKSHFRAGSGALGSKQEPRMGNPTNPTCPYFHSTVRPNEMDHKQIVGELLGTPEDPDE